MNIKSVFIQRNKPAIYKFKPSSKEQAPPKIIGERCNQVQISAAQNNILEIEPSTNCLKTRRYLITGSRRVSNYWWAIITSLGGFCFFFTGFSAFLNQSLFFFNQSKNISFLPQGLIMCFYGSLGLLFGFYLWCTIFWKVGNGFNEFNKKQGFIRIFRWGFPGKQRRIDLIYKMEQVNAVRVELTEGINPRRTISLRIDAGASKLILSKEVASSSFRLADPVRQNIRPIKKRQYNSKKSQDSVIPLTRIGQPLGLQNVEKEASELARFLAVPLDNLYGV